MEHLKSTLSIRLAQSSKAGGKPDNQDTIGARIPEGSLLAQKGIAIAIADGVSSSLAAKHASQSAVTGFLSDYYATPDTWRTQTSAARVIQALNRHLWAQGQNSVRQEGHLTTFSVLLLKGETAFTFHVGDSRIYRFRADQLERLTRDHSQRIDRKTVYLTRALGADPSLEIDVHFSEIETGDLFLLTTDGVHDVLTDHDLEGLCTNWGSDPDELVEKITQAAISRDTTDNLSVQACLVVTKGTISKDDSIAALVQLPFPPLMDVGHQLDELRVCKVIHESERSQIYLVETKDGKRLALKTPTHRYQDDPAYIERFVMESWIGSRIQSPHVVKVVEPPVARSCLYYLTEYIQGPTLAELIRQRAPFDIPDATEIIEQVARGARAMHRKETLHQDIKPANIMVSPKGAVLVDFGSCRVGGITEVKAPFMRDTVLGTLEYSAPEYRFGGKISESSDQFALGVVLYEMLTRKKPYGDRYAAVMDVKAMQKLKYIPATHYNPLVPVWLDKAIEKSVNISPMRRYEALSELLTDLRRPNPAWLSEREKPWMEQDPLRFWKTCAAVGWLTALLVLLVLAKG